MGRPTMHSKTSNSNDIHQMGRPSIVSNLSVESYIGAKVLIMEISVRFEVRKQREGCTSEHSRIKQHNQDLIIQCELCKRI